jgi:hypothetical protein
MFLPTDRHNSDLEARALKIGDTAIAGKNYSFWTDQGFSCCSIVQLLFAFLAVLAIFICWRLGYYCIPRALGCRTIAARGFNLLNYFAMAPLRGPVNTKGLKTERTHEENQERFVSEISDQL